MEIREGARNISNAHAIQFEDYRAVVDAKPGRGHSFKITVYKGDKEICNFNRDGQFFGDFFKMGDQVWFWSGTTLYDIVFVNQEGLIDTKLRTDYIWLHVEPSLDGQVLAVKCSQWASPSDEMLFVDFRDPKSCSLIQPEWDTKHKFLVVEPNFREYRWSTDPVTQESILTYTESDYFAAGENQKKLEGWEEELDSENLIKSTCRRVDTYIVKFTVRTLPDNQLAIKVETQGQWR